MGVWVYVQFFISELLTGHWEEGRDIALHCTWLFLVFFTVCRNICSSHCKILDQSVHAAPTKPGGGAGAEGELWVQAEWAQWPLKPLACKTSGMWVHLRLDTSATAPKPVWMQLRSAGDFTVS